MTHLWEAEQIIEPLDALRLIQEQFPEVGAEKIKLLGVGWDNSAFIVNDTLIFRFPRREIAVPLLETEWCFLPKLAPRLPLSIPVPKWKGIPSSNFPWPFIGYPKLSGMTACHANIPLREREALAVPLAHFLKILHATSEKEISECHIERDNLTRIDGNKLTFKIQKNFDDLSLLGLLEHRDKLESVIADSQNFRSPRSSAVVHGDFYIRHLLVNEQHHLTGVIDWGDVHFGDPAIDLALAHSFLPRSAHDAFRKAYGEISEPTWALARLRAIFSSSYLILFGHHSGDSIIAREGLLSLKLVQGCE